MRRIICAALLVLAGCATTNRGASLRAEYRAADPALGAPVGAPVLNGKVLSWNTSPEAVQAQLPGVAFARTGDWLTGAMTVDGHAATVGLGFGQRGLSRVTVTFVGEGRTLRETYAQVLSVLKSELGEPVKQVDAKADAVREASNAVALRLLADMADEWAAALHGETCRVEADSADGTALGNLVEAVRARTPDYLETAWSGPGGKVALLGNPQSSTPLQMLFLASSDPTSGADAE